MGVDYSKLDKAMKMMGITEKDTRPLPKTKKLKKVKTTKKKGGGKTGSKKSPSKTQKHKKLGRKA
tara:strand:- start:1017 stop:1211 length:195 start_codon:yes stop_codon:yes gene_type:complete